MFVRHQKGFTVIEVMIAVVIGLIIITALTATMVAMLRQLESSKLEQLEAAELNMLANAFKAYNPNNKLAWALGSRTETTMATLITAGHLSSTFGNRHGSTNGRTPYGNTYRIFSVVDATKSNVLRTIITESGTASVSMLDRAGVPNTNAEIRSLKERIGQKVTENSKWYTATVPESSTTAAGALGSFTQVLTTWLGANAAQPIAVVFVGWPEYDPTGGSGTPQNAMNFGTCVVEEAAPRTINGTTSWQNGSCPAGQTQVKLIPHCAASGQISAVPEIGASVTFGQRTAYLPNNIEESDRQACKMESGQAWWQTYCDDTYASVQSASNEDRIGLVTINNVTVKEYVCGSTDYDYRASYWGRQTPLGPHLWQAPNGYQDAICCSPP